MKSLSTKTVMISGDDGKDFLQGQLSNDLNRLDKTPELLAAWCTPKGRVISIMTVSEAAGDYALRVPADLVDAIVKRLTMFRFRSKVDFSCDDVAMSFDAAAAIRSGLPWIGREQSEKFTPHMLNLDLLDGISLDKGCYTGQEIVARTHYKGATKRRTLRFSCSGTVAVADKVSLQGRDVGEVLNVAGNELLAVVPLDKATGELAVNGARLTHLPIAYLPDPM